MGTNLSHLNPGPESKGIVCSRCGGRHFYTVYTRARASSILRLKQCRYCGRRVYTKEKIL